MKKSHFRFSTLFLILLAGIFCLAVAGTVWAMVRLPVVAEKEFGPSSTALSETQRILYSARLFLAQDDLNAPETGIQPQSSFVIETGESAPSIANRLEKEGLIRSARTFLLYLVYSGKDTSIQAGEYRLGTEMDALEIALALQDATPEEVTFQILPGWRLEEIAESLPTSGLEITSKKFLRLANSLEVLGLSEDMSGLNSLEGFMFPDSYTFKRDILPEEFFREILDRFEAQITPELQDAFEQQGLTLQEAVILSSIVQREAMISEEQPMIASVFLNRLNAGMKLESDPTVQYALGYDEAGKTWWKNPLFLNDLKQVSPYNTYINEGLPPGPICSPGLSALQSVAYPAETPYYYFRATCDGSGQHTFSITFEEHLGKACP